MDLLSTLLKSMEKPPSVSDKEKERIKQQRLEMEKRHNEEKERLKKFREKTEKHLADFISDSKRTRLKYPPMDHIYRGLVRETAEEAGFTTQSFGEEGTDRYIMIFKKEFPPSDDELAVLRDGGEWTEEKRKELELQRLKEKEEALEDEKKSKEEFKPNTNYKLKYQHLIGLEAAKEAAEVTKTNKQYGFVPSENKRDHRSIEETLADIKKKKKKPNPPDQ